MFIPADVLLSNLLISYGPWHGRGFLQLTHPHNYISYWSWKGKSFPTALETALRAAHANADRTRVNTSLQDANFPTLTPEIISWRLAIEGASQPRTSPANTIAPSDSAGYYWLKTGMARYADQDNMTKLERQLVAIVDNQGRRSESQMFYRSLGFWRVSAAVNLPGRIDRTNYQGLNGFDARCCAFGVALATLTEILFPDAQGNLTLAYPEGYTRRTS